jgi:hypothetical protein
LRGAVSEIIQIERQRAQAIESLEISNNSVKCQKCNLPVPIVGRLPRSHADRITILEKRIRQVERYHGNNSSNSTYKQLKEELVNLLREEAKNDILKSVPLYSSKNTGFRLFCSKCYDEAYLQAIKKR